MNKKSHDEYSELTRGIHRVFEVIHHDRSQLRDLPHDRSDGFFRRTLLRHLFAETEVLVFQVRLLLQIAHEAGLHDFGQPEVAALYEVKYEVDDKGNAKEKRLTLRTVDNIQFVFNAVSSVTRNAALVDRSGADWDRFKKVIRKRDLVTHPRTVADFEVDDSDFEAVLRVATWLDSIFGEAFKQMNNFFFPKSDKCES